MQRKFTPLDIEDVLPKSCMREIRTYGFVMVIKPKRSYDVYSMGKESKSFLDRAGRKTG